MLVAVAAPMLLHAQDFNQIDEEGNVSRRSGNFNPHNKDTTKKAKVIPRGMYVWTVDRRFGDITRTEPDTLPHLFPHTTLGTGPTGEYNTVGNNYSARLSRIFANRPLQSQFGLADVYSQMLHQPDEWHFTNTLSPITNLTYNNCGDKTNGKDHIDARFAANFGKRLGFGFDLDYLYARGYFQNQNNSHFNTNIYASYLGDQYQMHALVTLNHQKATENGGITDDEYVTHPEIFTESYQDSEIPVVLDRNWNRHNQQRLFLTHRYALGFYRKVKMTEEELRARQFAAESAKEREKDELGDREPEPELKGRPDDARIAGDMPKISVAADSLAADTTRIAVDSKAMADSLMAVEAQQDSIDQTMKREFVPVTSFIHTLEMSKQERIYQAYATPSGLYADTFFSRMNRGYSGDSIYDQTRHLDLRNTLAIALLEGFNKYVPSGLKVFATHELRRFELPWVDEDATTAYLERLTEHNVSLGGQLLRQQGRAFHYDLTAETWVAGEDLGQLKLDGRIDLNFPLLGDTVRLAARGYFYRLNPTFMQRHYHSKHFWWDANMSKEMRTRVEGNFSFDRTKTRLRVAVEEIQNYTYLGLDYTISNETRQQLSAQMLQHSGNINVLTAQLDQRLRLGPLHWDNTLTYQSSSNKEVLPLPTLNVFSNLYLDFMVAHVLRIELGAAATYFTKYTAPDFCPQLNQFGIQQNETTRLELGNFPFVDVYANMHLKHARFFVMMTNALASSFNRQVFLTPHYPIDRSVLQIGISWNFFN